jgi:hypothetical protein
MFCLFLVLPSSLRVGLGSGSTFPMPCAVDVPRFPCRVRRFESDRGQKRKKVMFCLFLVLPSSLRVGLGSGSTFPMPFASVHWGRGPRFPCRVRRFESDRGQKRKKVMFCLVLVLPSSLRVGPGSGSTFPMPCASVRIRSWAKKKKGYVLPLFGVAQQPACGAGVGVHVSHAVCVGSNPIVGKKEKRLCFASFWCCPASCVWGWGQGPRFPCRVRRFESDRGQKRKKVMFCLILVLPSSLRVGLGSGSTFPMPCASVRIRSWAKKKKGYVLPLFGVAQQPACGAGVGVHVSHAVCVGSNPIVGKKEKRLCFASFWCWRRFESDRGQKRKKVMFCLFLVLPSSLRVGLGSGSTFPMPCASVRIRSWAKKKKGYVLPRFGVAQQPARGAGVGVHVSHAVCVGSNPIVGKKEKRLCFASFWCCPAACVWGWGRGPRFPCRVRRFESDRGQKRKKVMFCLVLVLPSIVRVGLGSGSTFPMPCASVRIRSWAKKEIGYVLPHFGVAQQPACGAGVGVHVSHAVCVGSNPIVGKKEKRLCFASFWCCPAACVWGWGRGPRFPCRVRRFESDRGQKRKKVMFCLFLVLASVRIRSWAKKKKGYVLPLFGVAQQPACGAGVGVHVSHAVCVGSNPIVGKKEKRLCFASFWCCPAACVWGWGRGPRFPCRVRRFESDRGQKRKKVMFCLFLVLPSSLRVGLGSGSTFPMSFASVRIRSWAKKEKGYVLPLFGVAQQPACGAGVGVHVSHAVCVGSNPIVGKKEKRLCFASFWCCPAACVWGWGRGPRFPCRVRRFESDRGQKRQKVMFCLFLVLASVRIRSWAKKKKGYVLPLFGVAQQRACGAGVGVHVSHAVCVGSNPIVGKKEKRLCFASFWCWRRFESDRGQKRKKVMFCLFLVLPSSLRVGLGSGSTFPMQCASVRIRSWAKKKKGYVLPLCAWGLGRGSRFLGCVLLV